MTKLKLATQILLYNFDRQLDLRTRPYHTGPRYGQWLADQRKRAAAR